MGFYNHHCLQICPLERTRLIRLSSPNYFRATCTYLSACVRQGKNVLSLVLCCHSNKNKYGTRFRSHLDLIRYLLVILRDECRCYANFIKCAPTLTVSDVLSLLLSDDTVTVLRRLDRFLITDFRQFIIKTFYPILDLTLATRFREKSVAKA